MATKRAFFSFDFDEDEKIENCHGRAIKAVDFTFFRC